MQQEQQNAFNRQCISEALIRLMETKAYDDISVTEICRMAGVSRIYFRYGNLPYGWGISYDVLSKL